MKDIKIADEINESIQGLAKISSDLQEAQKKYKAAMEAMNNESDGYLGEASENLKTVEGSGIVQLEKLSTYYGIAATFATNVMISLMNEDDRMAESIINKMISGEYEGYLPKKETTDVE